MGLPAESGFSSGNESNNDASISRSRLAVAFVEALREAEAVRTASEAVKSPVEIAREAYEQLCFDFPLVSTDALDALALVLKSNLAVTGRMPFPITPRLLAGLSYLASPTQAPQPGKGTELSIQSPRASLKGDADKQSTAVATILACILVVAPSRALTTALTNNGQALRDYLGSYQVAAPDGATSLQPVEEPAEPPCDERPAAVQDLAHQPPDNDDDLADDSDWEPMEGAPSGCAPLLLGPLPSPANDGHALTWQQLIGRLTELSSHIRYQAISSSVVWGDPSLRLASSVLDLLASLKACGERFQVTVAPAMSAYLALLTDRLAAVPAGGAGDGIPVVVPRVLAVLGPPVAGQPPLGPAFLSSLVVALRESPHGGPTLLWPSLHDALPDLAAHVHSLAQQSERSHEWVAQVEGVMGVLAFFVEEAPGNADVGPPLLQTGVFRESLALFTSVGAAPPLELLRRFLLLSTAACPTLAHFASAVPAFVSATMSEAFLDSGNAASLHAALWPILLTPSPAPAGTEQRAAEIVKASSQCLQGDPNPDAITLAGALGRLHRFLSLLQAIVQTTSTTRMVWTRRGPLEQALAESYKVMRSTMIHQHDAMRGSQEARPPMELSTPNSDVALSARGEENDMTEGGHLCHRDLLPDEAEPTLTRSRGSLQAHGSTANEKLRVLVPTILKQLKAVMAHSDGEAIGKSD